MRWLLCNPHNPPHGTSHGRVVAVLKTDVAAGDELCNSYIDVELEFAQRQRELLEYGFVCACARCVAEKPAAAARPARKLK